MTFSFDWDELEQRESTAIAREPPAAGRSSEDTSAGDVNPLSDPDPTHIALHGENAATEPVAEPSPYDSHPLQQWQSSSPAAFETASMPAVLPLKPPCSVAEVGEHYEIVNKLLILRSGQELATPEVGRLNKGMHLEIIEIGVGRRVKVMTQNGTSGWASLTKEDGKQLLERVYLTEAQAKRFSRRQVVYQGRIARQPGDGNCLFHSLNFGMRVLDRASGHPDGGEHLRLRTLQYMKEHAHDKFGDCTLEQWVKWETEEPIHTYLNRMTRRPWSFAGAVEMAAFARMTNVNVEVYEACATGFKKISVIEARRPTDDTITVAYQSRVHYDALVLDL